jgi:hypothetical protein
VSAPAKLAAFAAILAVLLGAGTLAGAALGPDREGSSATAAAPHGDMGTGGDSHADAEPAEAAGGHGGGHAAAPAGSAVRGLAVADGGLRLELATPELARGREQRLRFAIVDEQGEPVRDFDVEHERRMHLIVVRRDQTGFQHLHPRQHPDGTWTTPVRIPEAGSYRMFADFSHGERPTTLATDLRVDGAARLRDLPAPRPVDRSDGYAVRLDPGEVRPGEEAELRFTITRDGRPAHTEPYLGAGGHLVALREGDLAFLHVHPTEQGDHADPAGPQDDAIGFAATFPTEARYRLFLQFKDDGQVHTVAFTQEVAR